jgi:hypothetical protein
MERENRRLYRNLIIFVNIKKIYYICKKYSKMTKNHKLKKDEKLFTSKGIETKWVFIKDIEYKKYGKTVRRIIEVICECGRKKHVQYNNVRAGHSVCCGFSPCRIPSNTGKRSIETSYNCLFYSYKKGAIDRGFLFDLDKDYFKKLLSNNCFYCDKKPSSLYQIKNSKTGEIRAGIPLVYNGIDRFDNKKGYTLNNCVTCCEICNRMKMASTADNFKKQIKKIYEFLKLSKYGESNTSQQDNC